METRDKRDKTGGPDLADSCKGFQGMFEKMAKCCPSEEGFADFSNMMEGMMKEMMEKCCGLKTSENNEDWTKTDNKANSTDAKNPASD